MQTIFEKLYRQENLTRQEMAQVANLIFEGQLSEAQLSAFLTSLKIKGETPEEMAGLAETIQQKALQIKQTPLAAMDNCGTGGDRSNSFNISTTAAFILAAAGIPMAKHGNRSISSRSGSADVLETLGIQLAITPEKISYLLNEVGIAFLFAPAMHPKMSHVMKVRKELGTPTILNLIGPLTNPVPLDTQLLGTYRRDLLAATAETFGKLGRRQGIVVNGAGGMDEANLSGENHYAFYQKNQVTEYKFTPEEVGFQRAPIAAIQGSGPLENAVILESVLKNTTSVYTDTAILNAGLGLVASGLVADLPAGIQLAGQIVASGAAYDKLRQLVGSQREVA
ncbi:anthranilate phosphoribosyltransferase [Enterococcus sp. LJL120]